MVNGMINEALAKRRYGDQDRFDFGLYEISRGRRAQPA